MKMQDKNRRNYGWLVSALITCFMVFGASLCAFASMAINEIDELVRNEDYFLEATVGTSVHDFGNGKVIAVLDTGINDDNQELQGQVIAEYNFVNNNLKAIDDNGHGTRIASIIAAKNNGIGIAGIAYKSKLLDVKVADKNGYTTTERIIEGINFAVKNKAAVINIGISSSQYSEELENLIKQYFEEGIVFVASAGNNGKDEKCYPAAYDSVISVGSLDKESKEIASYSNKGAWVDCYIDDDIWTYDGKNYSREKGTSEAAAVISGAAALNTKNIVQKVFSAKHARKSQRNNDTSISQEQDYFEKDDQATFLNLTANYMYFNEKSRYFTQYLIDKKYLHLEKYSLNGLNDLYEINNQYFNKEEFDNNTELFDLILYDMLKTYISISYATEFNKFKDEQSSFLAKIKSDFEFKNTIEEIKGGVNVADNLQKSLNILIEASKGDSGIVAKNIRKLGRFIYGPYTPAKPDGIWNYKSNLLLKKSDKLAATKILKYAPAIFRSIDYITTLAEEFEQADEDEMFLKFVELCGHDFLISILPESEDDIDEYYWDGLYTDFGSNFFHYIRDFRDNHGDKFITTLVDSVKKQLDEGHNFNEVLETGKFFVDMSVIFKTAKSPSLLLLLTNFASLCWDQWNERQAYVMYSLFRRALWGLKCETLFHNDNISRGYITSKQLRKNLFASLFFHKFTFYATVYLKTLAENPHNLDDILIQETKRIVENYQITENGIDLIEPDMGTLRIISNNVIDILLSPFNLGKELVTGTIQHDRKDLNDYLKETNTIDIHESFSQYAIHINELITYEYYISECLGAKIIFDEVADDNLSIDSRIATLKLLYFSSEKLTETLQHLDEVRGTDKQDMFDTILFQYETGINLMNEYLFSKMSSSITRKDFMIMMLKGAAYNPYEDEDFLRRLLTGKIEMFDDIVKYFPNPINQKEELSFNEVIWILYGREKGIINGYKVNGGSELRPFENISRLHAMTIAGRTFRQRYDEISFNGDFDIIDSDWVFTDLNITDYDDLNKSEYIEYKNDVKTCVQAGLIQGAKQGDGTALLLLDHDLKIYESQKIALRFYEAIKKEEGRPTLVRMVAGNTTELYFDHYVEQYSDEIKDILKKLDELKVNSLFNVYPDLKNELWVKTTIDQDRINQLSFTWAGVNGKFTDFSFYINNQGKIETKVYYTPPYVTSDTVVPIFLYLVANNGEYYKKDYFVNIVSANQDSDQDGMPDEWEIEKLGDLSQDGIDDYDKDGLSNLEECKIGSNPINQDTDNDGIPDGWEIDNGLNPLVYDSFKDRDNDGISNIDEYNSRSVIFIETIGDRKNGNVKIVSTELSVYLGTGGTVKIDGITVPATWTSEGITLSNIYSAIGLSWEDFTAPLQIEIFDQNGIKIAETSYPFSDVGQYAWYTRPIMKLWKEDVVSGYAETKSNEFKPDQEANRAEYVTVAVVADEKANEPGREYSEYTGAFDDVNTDDWFAKYVQYAKDQSIIQGCETNLFCPGDTINRAEAVTVTDRTFGRLQTTLEAYKQGKTPATEFTDVTDASKWYYPFVYTAMEEILINGYKDGSFKPGNPVTRAEMAKINCIAAFGVKACMFTGELDTPFVTSVFPRTATLDESTTFTVKGYNLPETTAFWIDQCDNLQSLGGTAEEQKFTCTPSYEAGTKSGVVKDQSGGSELYPFTIQVFEEKPVVTSVSPLTATLNQEKIFTVSGSNLPDTLAFFIPECENLQKLSGTSEQYQFSCTPSYTAGIKDGLVKDMSGDAGNILKEFAVTVQDETTPADPGDDPVVDPGDDPVVDPGDDPVIGDPVVYSVKPLEATLGELTPFTVTGENLPDTTAFWIDECDDLQELGGTSTQRQFKCVPSYKTGSHEGVVKDKPEGNVLHDFSVNFLWGTPEVESVGPEAAYLNQLTEFKVIGSSLPETTIIWIDGCKDVTPLGGDANERGFHCTPSYDKTGTLQGLVKDKSGDTGTVLKTFTVNVQ